MTEEHLDPTSEITLEAIKKRALRGVVVLTGRTFVLSLVSLLATGFLTVFLEPSQFGVFWVVSAIVNFLAYFSDIGLAAALIQKKEKIDDIDLKTTFTVQQVLVVGLLLILFFLTPVFAKVYSLTPDGRFLIYALGLSLFLSSLKTIPSVLLERDLEFEKLVVPQVLENLAYNLVAVFFAWKGFGINSFTYAILVRGFVGLFAIYILKPWKIAFAFSKKPLVRLLKFGIPYQVNSLLATLKDDGMTAVLGGILGTAGLGLLGWAQKWGQVPLRFFMDHVIKVSFPAFSRLQGEKKYLEVSVTKSIFFICFLTFPTLAALLIFAPSLIEIIPRYGKWEPALIPLSLIAVNTVFASVATQLTNLLNAIGKIKTTFKLMVMWTILTWLLVPGLAYFYGVNGAAAGYALVGVSSVVAIYVTSKLVKFSLSEAVLSPLVSTAIMSLILITLKRFLPVSITYILLLSLFGGVVYLVSSFILTRGEILGYAKKGLGSVVSKD